MIVTTYLQMFGPPAGEVRPWPPTAVVRHIPQPTVPFYRALYHGVGHAYEWTDRQRLSDEALAAIIHHPAVAVHVLYVAGEIGGYLELDHRQWPEVELAYFGLMPPFVGRGFGLPFLQWGVAQVWQQPATRLWVHTCNLDHPNALSVYQKAGFTIYDVR